MKIYRFPNGVELSKMIDSGYLQIESHKSLYTYTDNQEVTFNMSGKYGRELSVVESVVVYEANHSIIHSGTHVKIDGNEYPVFIFVETEKVIDIKTSKDITYIASDIVQRGPIGVMEPSLGKNIEEKKDDGYDPYEGIRKIDTAISRQEYIRRAMDVCNYKDAWVRHVIERSLDGIDTNKQYEHREFLRRAYLSWKAIQDADYLTVEMKSFLNERLDDFVNERVGSDIPKKTMNYVQHMDDNGKGIDEDMHLYYHLKNNEAVSLSGLEVVAREIGFPEVVRPIDVVLRDIVAAIDDIRSQLSTIIVNRKSK